jgi:hypothetical protein
MSIDSPTSKWLAGILAGSTIMGTLALTAPFVLSRSPLPFMATPGHKVRRALTLVQQQRQRQVGTHSPTVFVDLGSGDGEAVYQAICQGGYTHAIGIELNRTLWLLSQMRRRFFWTRVQCQQSRFLAQDFFAYNVKDADTVMIFGVKPLMEPLSIKLARECRPGTHILAYRFPLPTVSDSGNEKHLHAQLVHDEDDMRIYRVET